MEGGPMMYPEDWPADEMPDSAPENTPAYVPRHGNPFVNPSDALAAEIGRTPADLLDVFRAVTVVIDDAPLVQCWNAMHPFGSHVLRDDCDEPFLGWA
jgi:hypothetical protein